jgi:predicted transposase YdaD
MIYGKGIEYIPRQNKSFKHLEILSSVRKLQPQTIKQINAMPIVYDLKSDLRYQQGLEEGIEKGRGEGREEGAMRQLRIFIENMLEAGYEDEILIAGLSNATIAFVQEVKRGLEERRKAEHQAKAVQAPSAVSETPASKKRSTKRGKG